MKKSTYRDWNKFANDFTEKKHQLFTAKLLNKTFWTSEHIEIKRN